MYIYIHIVRYVQVRVSFQYLFCPVVFMKCNSISLAIHHLFNDGMHIRYAVVSTGHGERLPLKDETVLLVRGRTFFCILLFNLQASTTTADVFFLIRQFCREQQELYANLKYSAAIGSGMTTPFSTQELYEDSDLNCVSAVEILLFKHNPNQLNPEN